MSFVRPWPHSGMYLGSFLEPEDSKSIRVLGVGAICNFVKGTRLLQPGTV
jgi:hypothetical protein